MQIIPAIDMINGKCVRLTEGDFDKVTEYSADPIEQAQIFKDAGVDRIHIVDLDGAKTGNSKNRNIIKEIKRKTNLIVQTGGGIRTEEDIKDLIHSGVDYLILGTVLVEKFKLIESLMPEYGRYLIAGVDVKDNIVKTKGWIDGEGIDPIELGRKLFQIGFKVAVYTDISKDGKMAGPNIEATKNFSTKTGLHSILSGGISSMKDIAEACTLRFYGLQGIIVGKAYYEGKVNLKEAVKKFKDK